MKAISKGVNFSSVSFSPRLFRRFARCLVTRPGYARQGILHFFFAGDLEQQASLFCVLFHPFFYESRESPVVEGDTCSFFWNRFRNASQSTHLFSPSNCHMCNAKTLIFVFLTFNLCTGYIASIPGRQAGFCYPMVCLGPDTSVARLVR
ncbi:hypothetical protein [Massilia antarctica]|uniref:hypothetical protein n=1 Tax=Massilia antarctica TaxID=2765360 RepID=UPI0035E73115